MKILVFDVPAISGGALSILTDFYKEVCEHESKDIDWIFVLSEPIFEESQNIKILNYPWVKKSWFHRIYFDKIYSRKIVKQARPDKIFSLQNTVISSEIKQILYVHQALPFSEYKIKLKDNIRLWIYQNIIGKFIYKSIKKADKVIVQTEWFKNVCVEKTGVSEKKIKVVKPFIERDNKNIIRTKSHIFFFPAAFRFYKNHKVIFEAAKILKNETKEKFEIILTVDEEEVKSDNIIYNNYLNNQLPITFIGTIPHTEVLNLYYKSTLIFPSFIETFGLPLLEAKESNSIIIAANEPYSNEILKNYHNAYFFDTFNSSSLAEYMKRVLNNEISYNYDSKLTVIDEKISLVDEVIKS